MTDGERRLHLRRVQAVAYQVNADGRRSAASCYLIELRGTGSDGSDVIGLGECQPRDALTGDRGSTSWDFLVECMRRLHKRDLVITDAAGALRGVRELMGEFRALSKEFAADANRPVPFRGTLAGLEAALLDVYSGALDCTVAEILGQQRTSVPVHAPPISSKVGEDDFRRILREQADGFSATVMFGTGDPEANLARLQEAADINRSDVGNPDKPLWIDVNGRLDAAGTAALIRSVVESIEAGTLPGEVVIEHPVGSSQYGKLPGLQRLADRLVRRRGLRANVLIAVDARWWLSDTLGRRAAAKVRAHRLVSRHAPKAVCIRPAQVGGVLASLDLGKQIQALHPETRIYLGGMYGGSRVTAATLGSLALAMPEIDAVSDVTLAGSPLITAPPRPAIDHEAVLSGAKEFFSLPEPEPPTHDGQLPNIYPEVTYLQPLGSNGTKGHLLEREALGRGLSTVRYSKGAFTTTDGVHQPLSFKWSRSPLSSAVSLALCTHKEATRLRLQRAGVPVPRGTTFAAGAYEAARAFVKRIGYPVVVKPAMGVRGIGVVANIQDDEALEAAFGQLESSKLGRDDFIVEQHISGRDYRIVVIGEEVVGAVLREPGSVTGDGERSIAELVIAKNIARRANPHLWGRPVRYDTAARFRMARAGLTLDYVPKRGEVVVLSGSCSLSQGGESIDVLDELHPDIKDAAVRAVKAVPGLAFCGVDFLIEDHTKPLEGQQAGICELNAHAAIGNCEYPLYGTGRPVARTLMEACIDNFGLKTTERADQLALKLVIRGRVTGVGYRAWMRRRANAYGLRGWVRNVNSRTIEAIVIGDMEPATALVAAAVLGPRAAIPTDVTTTHLESPPDVSGFEIKRSVKERIRGR